MRWMFAPQILCQPCGCHGSLWQHNQCTRCHARAMAPLRPAARLVSLSSSWGSSGRRAAERGLHVALAQGAARHHLEGAMGEDRCQRRSGRRRRAGPVRATALLCVWTQRPARTATASHVPPHDAPGSKAVEKVAAARRVCKTLRLPPSRSGSRSSIAWDKTTRQPSVRTLYLNAMNFHWLSTFGHRHDRISVITHIICCLGHTAARARLLTERSDAHHPVAWCLRRRWGRQSDAASMPMAHMLDWRTPRITQGQG